MLGSGLLRCFERPVLRSLPFQSFLSPQLRQPSIFSSLLVRYKHEYAPRFKKIRKAHKGRVPVRTGGSIKGCTLKFGKFGMRLKSEGTRLKAIQLKEADVAIMRYLRPLKGKLIRRVVTDIPVAIKGNETRMGKGKGSFSHWMTRVPTGKILFEIRGDNVHEQIAKEAFRVAGDKLPGTYEFVKIGDDAKVGFARVTPDDAKRNYVEEMKKNPNKKLANILAHKSPEIRQYLRR
jgi:ribosomal protein L16